MKGKSYATERPLERFEARQCCDILGDYGLWSRVLKAQLPGLDQLATAPDLSDTERHVFDHFDVWAPMLCVVLRISRDREPLQYIDLLREHPACWYSTARFMSESLWPYSVRNYEHWFFDHMLDEVRAKKSLVKYSCWVTEHFNIVWKQTLLHHTSQGGGRARADGDTQLGLLLIAWKVCFTVLLRKKYLS